MSDHHPLNSADLVRVATLVDTTAGGDLPVTVPRRLYLDGVAIPGHDFTVTTRPDDALTVNLTVRMEHLLLQPHLYEHPGCRHVEVHGLSCLTTPIRDWTVECELVDGELVPQLVTLGVFVRELYVVTPGDELDPATPAPEPRRSWFRRLFRLS
jgi:hypothetical protein